MYDDTEKTSTIAIVLGLILVVFSIYQFNETITYQNKLDEATTQIETYKNALEKMERVEALYIDAYLEIWKQDYIVAEELDLALITEAQANLTIDASSLVFLKAVNLFIEEFCILDTTEESYFAIKPEFRWLFLADQPYDIKYSIFNPSSGENIEVDQKMNLNFVYFMFLDSNYINPVSFYWELTKWNASYVNDTWFYYQHSFDIMDLTLSTIGSPFLITIDRASFNHLIRSQQSMIDSYGVIIESLAFAINGSTIGLLILGFFIDFEERKGFKFIFMAIAAWMTLQSWVYSLF
jgi:ABC-type cobalt transport system substrate-binding protein